MKRFSFLCKLIQYYSSWAAGQGGRGRPCYLKIRLTQPNLVELGLRLSLAIYNYFIFIQLGIFTHKSYSIADPHTGQMSPHTTYNRKLLMSACGEGGPRSLVPPSQHYLKIMKLQTNKPRFNSAQLHNFCF